MSLSLSLQNALSSLSYTQSALQVTSNNVANSTTEGYSRKTITAVSQVLDSKGAGVLSSSLTRKVDENLIRDLRTQTSDFGYLDSRTQFLKIMQDMFGSLASNSSLSASLTDLSNKIEALATLPEDSALRQTLLSSATAVTRQLNEMSDTIQTQRAIADNQIAEAVTDLNSRLGRVKDLNDRIARATALNQSTAELEDARDIAISDVANLVDITTFKRSTGEIIVMTKSGRVLVDSFAATVAHTPVSGMDASIAYPATINGLTIDGFDVTTEIKGGRIGALIDIRDTTLPNLQAELNALATQLRDQVNAVHNDGVGFPAPNTLTGTTTVAGGDAFAGTGIVRIAVVDANGNAVAAPLDLNLVGLADVDAVAAAINGSPLAGDITATIVGGKLVINADNANNSVAINEGTSSVGGSNRGFSHYFGLNDFFIGDSTVSLARNIAVRADIISNPNLISRGQLSEAVLGVGSAAITAGGNAVVTRLAAAFTSDFTYAAAGKLPPGSVRFHEYATMILAENANETARSEDARTFRNTVLNDVKFRAQSVSGVNIDEEMANLVVLQNQFAAASRVISVTAELMELLTQLGR